MLKGFIKKAKNCTTNDARFLYLLLLGREPHSPAEAAQLTEQSFFGAVKRLLLSPEFRQALIDPFFIGKRPMQVVFDEVQGKLVRQGSKTHFKMNGNAPLGQWPQCLASVLQAERAQKAFLKVHSADRLEYLLRHLAGMPKAPEIIGAVHQDTGKSVRGFAFAAKSETPLELEFYLNGKPAGECIADKENRLVAADLKVQHNIGFTHDLVWSPEAGVHDALLTVFEKQSGVMVCPPKEVLVDVKVSSQLLARTLKALGDTADPAHLAHQANLLRQAVELPLEDYDLYCKVCEPGPPPASTHQNRIGIMLLGEASETCLRAIKTQSHEAACVVTSIGGFDANEIDYIVPLQGDAILHQEALAWINFAAGTHPDASVVRFGHDFQSSGGKRVDPVFTAEFDLLTLLQKPDYATAYAVKTSALSEGLDLSNASGFWNNLWRSHGDSAFANIPGILLTRQVPSCGTELKNLDLPAPAAGKLAIIIPTKNRLDLIKPCVESLQATLANAGETEIIIVDNGSDEPETTAWLSSLDGNPTASNVSVLRAPEPFNWAALNNKAAAQTEADMLLFLNDDTKAIEPGWDSHLRSLLAFEDVGVVGAKLLFASETIQHAGVILKPDGRVSHEAFNWPDDMPGYEDRLRLTRTAEAVTGAFLACTRTTFDQLGGFDAESFPITYNDIDFCLRVSDAGKRTIYSPLLKFYHLESQSRGYDSDLDKRAREKRERARLLEKWPEGRLTDRYFPSQLRYDNGINRLTLCGPIFVMKDT